MFTLLLSCLTLLRAESSWPDLRGPYLGQTPPGAAPVLFAPGLVSTGLPTRDLVLSPDGSEIYFTIMLPGFHRSAVCLTRYENGRWTRPEVASFAGDGRWRTLEPCIAPDGRALFFVSDRPEGDSSQPGPFGIWMAERRGAGWGAPVRLPACINGDGEAFFPSVTRDGTLYFLREKGQARTLLNSRREGTAYRSAEPLPAPLNRAPIQANPCVDPDGRFLIVPMWGRPDSLGGADYYISFRRPEGGWTEPQNMGAPVNSTDGQEYSASLSPDGRYLFFMSGRYSGAPRPPLLDYAELLSQRTRPGNGNPAIWWMEAAFIEGLRGRAFQVRKD